MEILDAYDLTGSFRDAAELAGCSHHTVAAHVAARDAGRPAGVGPVRAQLIDEYLAKVEEWVEQSFGKIRGDKAHDKLLALGYEGSERTTRRAVAVVKKDYRAGRRRVHRPWITEPGMWLQYDFGDGPVIDGVKTTLFCAWLAWSRFRVVLAIRDKTMPSVFAALDVTLRRLGGAPTYVLTDNEKTVTVEHVAGIAVRNPQMVAFARHYAVTVHTCEPADPATKGGSESTVKLAKADLVPKDTNLLPAYGSFAELEAACEVFCQEVNTRVHRVTRRAPVEMLAEERARLHPVPAHPLPTRVQPLRTRLADPHVQPALQRLGWRVRRPSRRRSDDRPRRPPRRRPHPEGRQLPATQPRNRHPAQHQNPRHGRLEDTNRWPRFRASDRPHFRALPTASCQRLFGEVTALNLPSPAPKVTPINHQARSL